MGCGETLFLATGGYVTCSYRPCRYIPTPRPGAVLTLLDDRAADHVVWIDGLTLIIRHPRRARPGDAQSSCDLDRHLADLEGPPCAPGWYRVVRDGERWTWHRIDGETT